MSTRPYDACMPGFVASAAEVKGTTGAPVIARPFSTRAYALDRVLSTDVDGHDGGTAETESKQSKR
jgi:hypothetical protein